MIPADLGLPGKFTSFRTGQLEAAIQIGSSGKRFVAHSMPTGAGKSIIYVAVSSMLDCRTLIATGTKGLQEQLAGDFPGIRDIRGQTNYPCKLLYDRKLKGSCADGPCHDGERCELHPMMGNLAGCAFYDAARAARAARVVVTNYDFWMSVHRYMEPDLLGRFDLLVLDEAHDAPNKLADFMTIELNRDECEEHLDSGLPPVEDGPEAWVEWATEHAKKLGTWLKEYRQEGQRQSEEFRTRERLWDRLVFLSLAHSWHRAEGSDPEILMPGRTNDWIGELDEERENAKFSPIWAHRYAEQYLFCGIPKIVMVSATLLPRTPYYLGVDEAGLDFYEHPSGFHPDRRPVYYLPTAGIGRRATDGQKRIWLRNIDLILNERGDRKGIVQVTSYDWKDYIAQNSTNRGRLITHNSHTTRQAIEQYRRAGPGAVLVSPSVAQGYDFPYSECEYMIISKIPFISNASAIIKARARSDKQYLNYVAALSLVQRSGRGMRAADDRCETFIVDDNFVWFRRAAGKMLPRWYQQAIKVVKSVPPAPPRLRS